MLVSPSHTVKIGEQSYTLGGSFAILRSVQEAFQRDILHVLFMIPDMRLDQVAHLIAIASEQKAEEVGQFIVDEIGATTEAYGRLKTELVAWLNVALAPKADREKKRAEMAKLFTPSPGTTTSASA